MNIIIKNGLELSADELLQVNATKARQWHNPPMDIELARETTLLLLKDEKDQILAQGELLDVDGITFNNKVFNIIGIGGIVANEWSKGYGRQIMTAIKTYVVGKKKTGVGFTNKSGFYIKCGFKIDTGSKKRFVYMQDEVKITNKEDEDVLYIDGEDKFMEKVLSSSEDILLPRRPDW